MKKYPNIVWILVDSVRSYHSEGDDRSKLPMMDRFEEHSIEFLNAVTSAPSTIMSISAMMSATPSYMIARNYDDFTFDNRYFISINEILACHGYFTMAFFRHPHPREKFSNMLTPVPRKYWKPELRHGSVWTNTDLHAVIKNALHDRLPQPAFLFSHFNCRKDPNTSEIVENALNDFIAAGFTYENTIYVLCSDHGYPDPKRGYTPEGIVRMGLTHDMILTDDNIKIPLYIRYPGCRPQKTAKTVSSLDIVPTLLDLAGVPMDKRMADSGYGISLKPLIDGVSEEQSNRRLFVRSDARLMFQTGRVTAIRNDNYKYLRYHDRDEGKAEAFFDLENDPWEGENIVHSTNPDIQQTVSEFRTEFNRQEQEAFQRQVTYTLWKFNEQTGQKLRGGVIEPKKILMTVEPHSVGYGELALATVQKTWPGASVDLLVHTDEHAPPQKFTELHKYTTVETAQTFRFVGQQPQKKYDLQLVFTINPSSNTAKELLRLSKKARSKDTVVLDCNMNAYQRRNFWYYRMRAVVDRLQYIRQEPRAFWNLLNDAYQVLAKRLIKRTI